MSGKERASKGTDREGGSEVSGEQHCQRAIKTSKSY